MLPYTKPNLKGIYLTQYRNTRLDISSEVFFLCRWKVWLIELANDRVSPMSENLIAVRRGVEALYKDLTFGTYNINLTMLN